MIKTRLHQLVICALFMGTVNAADSPRLETIQIGVNSSSYLVELAATTEHRQRGLMFREKLDPGKGMLFAYAKSGDHRIWMKNTLIPLWVIWIDEAYRVISIQRLVPCETSPCKIYAAPTPSRFILELGDYEHSIKLNDRVRGINIPSW
jgi:uncharacterized membrane protein (UPF0127 family)